MERGHRVGCAPPSFKKKTNSLWSVWGFLGWRERQSLLKFKITHNKNGAQLFFGRKRGGSPATGYPPIICNIITQCIPSCPEGSSPHFSHPSKQEICKTLHIVDDAILSSLPTPEDNIVQRSQIAHSTTKSVLCSTSLLEMPSNREPWKASTDEKSHHDIGLLAHISRTNGHSINR